MHVTFDTQNVYYLPQYTPVLEELLRRGHESSFVCYKDKNDQRAFASALEESGVPVSWFRG